MYSQVFNKICGLPEDTFVPFYWSEETQSSKLTQQKLQKAWHYRSMLI